MPVSGEASEAFSIVSASLWYHGHWGGMESAIAARIFKDHCRQENNGAALVLDVGSHVGYFSLLALAHGCHTRTLEYDARLLRYLNLSIHMNNFDSRESLLHWGYVGNSAYLEGVEVSFHADAPSNSYTATWEDEISPRLMNLDDLLPAISEH